jgi:hypothetical protein
MKALILEDDTLLADLLETVVSHDRETHDG